MPPIAQVETSPVVVTRGLTRDFGSSVAVSDLSLRVPAGSLYGFLGPNGAGKTTTIRMLLGLLRPTHGDTSIFGSDLREHRKSILARVGALVEAPGVYPHLTGRENLQVVARLVGIAPIRIGEALRRVELADAAHKRVSHYSQGMKQRLGLAIALLNEPQLLILDEPTNGLDPAGIRDVRELLRQLATKSGITVFLSSHLLSEVELMATHLGIIQQGKLLFQGTLEDLRRTRGGHTLIRTNDSAAALKAVAHQVPGCRLNRDGLLDLESCEPSEAARVNQILVRAGFDVYGIETRRDGLEALFMEVTGDAD